MGAAAAEPAAVDDRNRHASLAGLEGGRFATGTGTDDHEIEGIHARSVPRRQGRCASPGARWRRASKSRTAAATETLRLSAAPRIGIRTDRTRGSFHVEVSPPASLPRTMAIDPPRSASA